MKSWLLEQGVPEEDILADDPPGLNHLCQPVPGQACVSAGNPFGGDPGLSPGSALYLGQQLGLSCEGWGTPNSVFKAQLPQNLLRESLARVKAFFNAEVLPPDPAPLLAPGA